MPTVCERFGALDRLADVEHAGGTVGLDTPAPETVVLDWTFDVPRERHTVTMPGADHGSYLLSVPYWNPSETAGATVTKEVDYFATHRVAWDREPEADWVAVSFDGFFPKERDSADVLVPLGACDELCS